MPLLSTDPVLNSSLQIKRKSAERLLVLAANVGAHGQLLRGNTLQYRIGLLGLFNLQRILDVEDVQHQPEGLVLDVNPMLHRPVGLDDRYQAFLAPL